MPYGGFGSVGVPEPIWKVPDDFDIEKFALARAQHRLARALRIHIAQRGMSEKDMEARLGYKRGYLIRKLNGVEALTVRDIMRIGKVFGPELMTELAE